LPRPDLPTVKDFLRFYIHTSEPGIDLDRPTVETMVSMAEWFFAGFEPFQIPVGNGL
jgi:hypothetical protein